MNKNKLLLLFLFFIGLVQANEFIVKSFKLDAKDFYAATLKPRKDYNGEKCAVIKILTELDGLVFSSGRGITGDVVVSEKENYYIIYLSPKERKLTMSKKGFVTFEFDFEKVPIEIESGKVYKMELGHKVSSFSVTSMPDSAQVFINNKLKGITPLVLEDTIGILKFMIVKPNYDRVKADKHFLGRDTVYSFKLVKTEPLPFEIKSEPPGAQIELNGEYVGETPFLHKKYLPGHYRLTLIRDGYEVYHQSIDHVSPKTILHVPLTPRAYSAGEKSKEAKTEKNKSSQSKSEDESNNRSKGNYASNGVTNFGMYEKGKNDASRLYDHGGGSYWVGCVTSGCSPVIGVIPALIVANQSPKPENLGAPSYDYNNNSDYRKGYNEAAYKIKKKKVWKGFLYGSGIFILLVVSVLYGGY